MTHKELKGECCEKCKELGNYLNGIAMYFCSNNVCPCHQSSQERATEETIKMLGKVWGTPKDPSTWEERFAERFCDGVMDGKDTDLVITEDIKSFIHKEIVRTRVEERTKPSFMDGFEAGKSQALQEVLAILDGMKKGKVREGAEPVWHVHYTAWNEALADVKEAIMKLMGDKSL